jgi:hypothetical protein
MCVQQFAEHGAACQYHSFPHEQVATIDERCAARQPVRQADAPKSDVIVFAAPSSHAAYKDATTSQTIAHVLSFTSSIEPDAVTREASAEAVLVLDERVLARDPGRHPIGQPTWSNVDTSSSCLAE